MECVCDVTLYESVFMRVAPGVNCVIRLCKFLKLNKFLESSETALSGYPRHSKYFDVILLFVDITCCAIILKYLIRLNKRALLTCVNTVMKWEILTN